MADVATRLLTQSVLDRCRAMEFAAAGIAAARPTAWRTELLAWLAAGRHGEMSYLAAHVGKRIDPAAMLPGAASIICVADRYHVGNDDTPLAADRVSGRIAKYARGRDYHKVIKKRLHLLCDELQREHPEHAFRACVDTAPVLEREHAQRAGLGAIGKNTLLIQPGAGSYLLLGEIITTLALEPTPSLQDKDPCGSCTRCIDACPTDAILPWSVDATRCISYLTIEHRSSIATEFHEAMGDWIFGCDICQDVCPHNQPTRRSSEAVVPDAYRPASDGFDLLEVLNWDEAARRDAFVQSALKRAKLGMMKRNALIVAGNVLAEQDDVALRHRVEQIASDDSEPELVRTTAQQVLGRLAGYND